MTVYVVAQMRFTDRESYDRYAAEFFAVFREHEGTVLAADEDPTVLEGAYEWEKVVLLSFPRSEAMDDWAESAAYQRISRDRHAGTESCVIRLRGL
jgi:uncharacterized protein (DUF1330 family)